MRSSRPSRLIIRPAVALLLLAGCAGTSLNLELLHENLPPEVAAAIEKRALYLARAGNLEQVYYLATFNSDSSRIHVGYFLVWPHEFPDFGRRYPAQPSQIATQLLAPLVYTNWFYLPGSGGLQRLLYGPGDVEGVAVIYQAGTGGLGRIEGVRFEGPGHVPITAATGNVAMGWSGLNPTDVSCEGAPCLQVATWSHQFEPPSVGPESVRYEVRPFPVERWRELRMSRRRAEPAKTGLRLAVDTPWR